MKKDTVGLRITLDGTQLKREVAQSRHEFKTLSDEVVAESARMDTAFKGIGNTLKGLGTAWSLKEMGNAIVKVRGEIEQLEVAFGVMLGSAGKSRELMSELTAFAAKTPFGLTEAARSAQQLIAYGVEGKDVVDTLRQLGDIAAGLNQPIGDLAYLYGTTMVQGRMYTQDLNQFLSRGIPLTAELAKQFGVAESEVKGLVEDGKVGFAQLQKAIESLTGEGGKFGGLISAQSATIEGRLSNLADDFDAKLNEIGQSSEGLIYDTIDALDFLVKNWEKVAGVMGTVAASYGVYKAALMATAAYEKIQRAVALDASRAAVQAYNEELEALRELNAEKKRDVSTEEPKKTKTDLDEAVESGVVTADRAAEIAELRELTAAKLEQATVAKQAADNAVEEASVTLEMAQANRVAADEAVNASKEKISYLENLKSAAEEAGEVEEAARIAEEIANAETEHGTLIDQAATAAEAEHRAETVLGITTEKQAAAAEALAAAQTNANTAATIRNTTSTKLGTVTKKADTVATKLATTAKKAFTIATNFATKSLHALKVAIATNPIGLIATALTTVIGLFMTFGDEEAEATEESERFGESALKTKDNVNTLFAVLNNVSSNSKVYRDSMEELTQIYKDYGIIADNEIVTLEILIAKRNELTEAILKEGKARQIANHIETTKQTAKEQLTEALEEAFKDAEWDMSGVFDDYDADEIQRNYKQATNLAMQIVEAGYEAGKSNLEMLDDIYKAFSEKGWFKDQESLTLDGDLGIVINDYISALNGVAEELAKNTEEMKKRHEEEELARIEQNIAGYQNPETVNGAITVIEKLSYLDTKHGANPTYGEIGSTLEELGYGTNNDHDEAYDIASNPGEYIENAIAVIEEELKKANTQEKRNNIIKSLKTLVPKIYNGSPYIKQIEGIITKYSDNSSATKKLTDERKKAEENLQKQYLALQQQNDKDEIALMQEGHEKKMKQIELEYNEQERKIQDKAKEMAELNKKLGTTGLNESGLTAEQQEEVDEALRLAGERRKKSEAEVLAAEVQAMRDYLTEYGSLLQQKLAIAETYAEKITKATSEGERLSLEKERDKKLEQVEVQDMLQSVDWYTALGGFGSAFEGQLRPILERLKEFTGTDAFKELDITQQKAIAEAMTNIRNTIGDTGDLGWEDLRDSIAIYQQSIDTLNQAKTEEARVAEELAMAQERLATASTDADRVSIAQEVENLRMSLTMASQSVVTATDAVSANGTRLAHTAESVMYPMSEVTTWLQSSGIPQLGELSAAFDQLKGGIEALKALDGLKNVANNAQKMGDDLADGASDAGEALADVGVTVTESLSEGLSKAGIIGQIVGAILKILDILKDGVGTLIAGLLDTILGAIDGIIENILSGEFIGQIIGSLVRGIGNILNTITRAIGNVLTLGLADGGIVDWVTNSNAQEVQDTIDRLTDRNELLTTAIESLTEEMKASKGTKSVAAYRRAYDQQKEVNQNYLDIAKAQAGYHNAHHSWNYYWNLLGGFTDDEIAKVSEAIGRDWDGSLWSLTPEEMEILRSFPDIWERIQNTGEGGYGERLTDALNDYIDQAGKLDELKDELYEGLTGISFDSMYDSFIDNLMDMEYSAKDAAEDISEYFAKAMLANKIGDIMSEDLEGWWEKFGAAMENDGTLDENERDALLEEYLGYMDEAEKWRDEIFAATGYNGGDATSQDSTKKGYATASQDSIDELNGRFTGVQMAVEQLKVSVGLMAFDLRGQRLDVAAIRQHTDEMRGLSLSAINHLADISRNTYQLYEINNRLGKIEKNTRYS